MMAKMTDLNKRLTQLVLDIVYLRFFEELPSSEIAEQLDIELERVKYKLKKPNVVRYIYREILPHTRKHPPVTLNTLDISSTIHDKLFYFASIMLFVCLAIICIMSFV
jgi:hypothetical protein